MVSTESKKPAPAIYPDGTQSAPTGVDSAVTTRQLEDLGKTSDRGLSLHASSTGSTTTTSSLASTILSTGPTISKSKAGLQQDNALDVRNDLSSDQQDRKENEEPWTERNTPASVQATKPDLSTPFTRELPDWSTATATNGGSLKLLPTQAPTAPELLSDQENLAASGTKSGTDKTKLVTTLEDGTAVSPAVGTFPSNPTTSKDGPLVKKVRLTASRENYSDIVPASDKQEGQDVREQLQKCHSISKSTRQVVSRDPIPACRTWHCTERPERSDSIPQGSIIQIEGANPGGVCTRNGRPHE